MLCEKRSELCWYWVQQHTADRSRYQWPLFKSRMVFLSHSEIETQSWDNGRLLNLDSDLDSTRKHVDIKFSYFSCRDPWSSFINGSPVNWNCLIRSSNPSNQQSPFPPIKWKTLCIFREAARLSDDSKDSNSVPLLNFTQPESNSPFTLCPVPTVAKWWRSSCFGLNLSWGRRDEDDRICLGRSRQHFLFCYRGKESPNSLAILQPSSRARP